MFDHNSFGCPFEGEVPVERRDAEADRRHGIRMVSIFSLMLSRLGVRGSDLSDVLGHLPGISKPDLAGDTHGGLVETSQLLALHPEWVERDYQKVVGNNWSGNGAARLVSDGKYGAAMVVGEWSGEHAPVLEVTSTFGCRKQVRNHQITQARRKA